eukprot:jgi/Mesen1/6102/ME000310S05203
MLREVRGLSRKVIITQVLRHTFGLYFPGLLALLALVALLAVLVSRMEHRVLETAEEPIASLRLLFITLEYKAGTFSGNGVYSQSMVRSLAKLGHSIFVIRHDNLRSIVCPVQHLLLEFEAGVTSSVAARTVKFRPDWVLVVDWSALGAFQKLAESQVWKEQAMQLPRMAYLNYRVYTLSEYKGEDGVKEREFYREKESQAVGMASAVAGLSSRDAEYLATALGQTKTIEVHPKALLPPLREDIRGLALAAETSRLFAQHLQGSTGSRRGEQAVSKWGRGRRYLCCCVRLSPEKNAELFAVIVERLASFLNEQGVVPLLCAGAGGGGAYAAGVKARVLAAVPSTRVVQGFMGPAEMAVVYSQANIQSTLLNVHPCMYDAYGMTIVEAAAFAAPSAVHIGHGGAVGATELLAPREGLALAVDLGGSPERVAEAIRAALLDRTRLAEVGIAAGSKSLSWSEEENAKELTRILGEAPPLISR